MPEESPIEIRITTICPVCVGQKTDPSGEYRCPFCKGVGTVTPPPIANKPCGFKFEDHPCRFDDVSGGFAVPPHVMEQVVAAIEKDPDLAQIDPFVKKASASIEWEAEDDGSTPTVSSARNEKDYPANGAAEGTNQDRMGDGIAGRSIFQGSSIEGTNPGGAAPHEVTDEALAKALLEHVVVPKVVDAVMASANRGVESLMEPIRRLAAIDAEIDDLEDALKKKKKERDLCDALALDVMREAKITSIPLWHDGKPISCYVATEFHAHKRKGIPMDAACAWMKKNGLEWMVEDHYQSSRLKSWVIETLADDDEAAKLPPGLHEIFDIGDAQTVRVIRTSKKESTTTRAARRLRAIKKQSGT